MKRLERKQEKERLERQIHQQMLKEQECLMKELRTMLPEAAESFSSERIVCLCHVVDLWACIVALFEAPTPLSITLTPVLKPWLAERSLSGWPAGIGR